MNSKKDNQKQSYKKSSTMFMQLGLILALFMAYTALEMEVNYKIPKIAVTKTVIDPDEHNMHNFIIEKEIVKPKIKIPKTKQPIVKIQPKVVDKIEIVSNTKKVNLQKLGTTEIDKTKDVTPVKVIVPTKKKKKIPNTVTILGLQEMPTFPGCQGSFDEKKVCFESKIRRHIQKHFDNDLAQTLDLEEGNKRIRVQFIVDENGNVVEIQTRADHKKLEKEAQRIIEKLPKMSPGKQNEKAVRVKYNVPINFKVEY